MSDVVRIANCSGFYGDRPSAAAEMVHGGPIDVLTGDWLAELTMLILARNREKRADGGYARTFLAQLEEIMGTCLDRGIKIVANAGGLDPHGCADAVRALAVELGLSPRIAYVTGDDLLPRLGELAAAGALRDFETGEPIDAADRYITANAYLGGWGITHALELGADIVVTGRTTDAALTSGPAAWFHGWARDDWDALAGAVAAGHVIECGTQATGGNYSFFTEIPHGGPFGFPWAEIAADGSAVIGKHDGTGGVVSVGTVTSQLLYEIGSPAYAGPDVIAHFETLRVEQVAADRVRISGAKGEPPPPTLKVAMNREGGFRQDVSIAMTGLDIEEKAAFLARAFWAACPLEPSDFESVTTQVLRTDKPDPRTNEEAIAVWRLTLRDSDKGKLGRPVFAARAQLGLATIPGFFSLGGERDVRRVGVYRPALVEAGRVPQQVLLLGGAPSVVESVAPQAGVDVELPPEPLPAGDPIAGATVRAPIGRLLGARSGDKGGNANLGVFARDPRVWQWMDRFLTVERLRAMLPEVRALPVERYRLPNLLSLNFVIHGLLGEGVAGSTRQDPQAKSLGEWFRACVVDIPSSLLEARPR